MSEETAQTTESESDARAEEQETVLDLSTSPETDEHEAADEPEALAEDETAAEQPVVAEAAEQQPALDPALFFALLNQPTPEPEPEPAQKRRRLRTALRWTSAVIVMGAIGAGTAYAVTVPRRTDIPGLATPKDGRYTFAPLSKPALPAGDLSPEAAGNKGQNHFTDIRQLLLAAPTGATVDPSLPGAKSWYSVDTLEVGFSGQDALDSDLNDTGVRHVAARGWTTPDGAHTAVYLLQFPDYFAASRIDGDLTSDPPSGFDDESEHHDQDVVPVLGVTDTTTAGTMVTVDHFATVTVPATTASMTGTTKKPGVTGRFAHFTMGDVLVVVEMTAPKSVPDVPMNQVVTLQAELLR